MSDQPTPQCLACNRPDTEIPLIQIRYLGQTMWICPQDLPLLIHQPAKLAEKLPGAEQFTPADHHD